MRKKTIQLLSIFFCALLFGQNTTGAQKFLDALFNKKYTEAHGFFADEVKGQISEQILSMATTQIAAGKGNYLKSTFVKTENIEDYERIIMKSVFENGSQNIMVAFNSEHKIVGFFNAPNETAAVRPQNPTAPFPYRDEGVTFVNAVEGNKLTGTLTVPDNFAKKSPAVILISGSGAQNRDSELLGHKPFLVIADHLARNGIASLRIDDRGTGKSEKGKEGATSEDFAGDISSAVNFLKQKGFSNIGLIGHSEGGLIAPMVASKNKEVKFLVLLAAPGVSGKKLLLKQSEDIGKASGLSAETLKNNAELNNKIYSFVENYKGNSLQKDIENLIRKNLKDLPAEQIDAVAAQQSALVAMPWFTYFLKADPAVYLRRTKIPVLALNGSKDLQVSAKENLSAIKQSLNKAGNKNFETHEIPDLNHLFQHAKTGSPAEYETIEETFAPAVLQRISAWILKR